ncbi:hypothetical protein [Streptomyces sp. NPDC005423]|uniref:hypothetical protein n=1 Tax=Streptomyces sp. NPDC005423 TaxID=3155343 RepID=UPI0033BDC98D
MDHFKVYISDEGLAEIDGDPLVPAPDQSVHEAVLDQLHRYAEARDTAVEATVNDGPGGAHFVLQVLPDGSSHVLAYDAEADEVSEYEEEVVMYEDELEPDIERGVFAPEPEWEYAPEQAARPEPAPEPAVYVAPPAAVTVTTTTSAIATAVARARARATAAARTPAPAPVDLPPAELTQHIDYINALANVGRLDEAFTGARALRESLTGSLGATHPHAVEARAVEAYLAYLRGDHREAIVLALAVARIRCGNGDGRGAEDVARAAAVWQQLQDDRAIIAHGRELLHMWDMLEHRGMLPPGYTELADQVRRQVDALDGAYV